MRKDTKARDFTRDEKMAIAQRDSIDGWTCCVFCGPPLPLWHGATPTTYPGRREGLALPRTGLPSAPDVTVGTIKPRREWK